MKTKIWLKPNTYIYLALLLLLVPFPWLAAWLIAVIFHELCHWLSVRLCGGVVEWVTVAIGGANMQSSGLSDGRRLLCILSGPVGGLVLILLQRWIPRIAICSWLLSMYNLLPVLPLDGGRALQIILRKNEVFYFIERCVLVLLTTIAFFAAFCLRLGILPLLIAGILWLKNRKTPCIERL